jgi:membrane-bound lytic murein transglycosylase D
VKILKLKRKFSQTTLRRFLALAFIFISLGIIRLFSFYTGINSDDKQYEKYFQDHYRIYSVNIPHDLNFAGEPVPLEDFEVRERIDREFLVNTYFQSQTVLLAKRSNRWLPIIARILKKNGIPDDFKFLAVAESGFMHNTSPKGAAGFWQFIPSTAQAYGLTINDEIDERYNPEKATEAACRFFKEAYAQFGNWTLAAASFNLGTNGLQKQIDRQATKSYYDLHLNEETSRYIFRVLALKEILNHPQNYGFVLRKKDLYPALPGSIQRVDSSITDLATYAQSKGTTYKMLKYYNPWLRSDKLTRIDAKPYFLRIPHASVKNYDLLIKEAEALNPEAPINDSLLSK